MDGHPLLQSGETYLGPHLDNLVFEMDLLIDAVLDAAHNLMHFLLRYTLPTLQSLVQFHFFFIQHLYQRSSRPSGTIHGLESIDQKQY